MTDQALGQMDRALAQVPSDPECPVVSFDEPWCYDSDPEMGELEFSDDDADDDKGSNDPRAIGNVISIEVDHSDRSQVSASQATTARPGEGPPKTVCPKSPCATSAWRAGAGCSEARGPGSQHNDSFAGLPYASQSLVLEEEMDDEAMMADATRTIKITIDSGAGNHVAAPQDIEGFSVQPSKASKRGQGFIAANGSKILNLGEAKVGMKEPSGKSISSTFQVAEVSRPLYSVSKICDEGCDVHFCATHASVIKGGVEVARFPRERGLYVAEMVLQPHDTGSASGFARQGAKA